MKCTNCGNELSENMKFCGKCGSPVNHDMNEEVSISETFSEQKTEENEIGKETSSNEENQVLEEGSNLDSEVPEVDLSEMEAQEMDSLPISEKESLSETEGEKAPSLKTKKPINKKWITILSAIFLVLIVGLGTGFVIVKGKTDDFRNFIAESENKAKSYKTLGKYSEEYNELVKEANELADGYKIFSFEEEKEKLNGLFTNVDELKKRVEGYEKKFKDIIDETEVKSKFIFGDFEEKYNDAKKKFSDAMENLDEDASKAGVEELEGMLSDIRDFNEEKVEEYQNTLSQMSSSEDYFDAEKGFINNAKKELKKALEGADYVSAEKVFLDFNEQKKRYDGIAKSDYFGNFIQMDVSNNKTIKLYYESDGNTWDANKFTLLERKKGGKKWNKAEIISMNQVEGELSIDLVADVSSSMEYMFSDMKDGLKNFAYSTDDGTKLGLSIISDVYRRESEFTEDKDHIISLIDNLYCDGLTSLYQSLYSSVIYTASKPGAKCVVAFTDGMNVPYGTGYDFSENDVIEVAQRYQIPVYIIALGSDVDSYVLNNIAYSTGGRYYENISVYDLYSVYEEIYNSQKEIYELTYQSTLDNKKEREVYINYYDENSGRGTRSEFSIKPDIILKGYSESGLIDSSNLESYYTDEKYLSMEEMARLSTIGELQTIINIYCAKAGYKFKDGPILDQMISMGVIKKNGTKTMDEITAYFKKDGVLWTNFSTLFNYRYEWIHRVGSRLFYDGYTDFDDLNEAVHIELGERKGRFDNDLGKVYKLLTE